MEILRALTGLSVAVSRVRKKRSELEGAATDQLGKTLLQFNHRKQTKLFDVKPLTRKLEQTHEPH